MHVLNDLINSLVTIFLKILIKFDVDKALNSMLATLLKPMIS